MPQGDGERQRRVNPNNKISLVSSPIGLDPHRLERWVCRIHAEADARPIASGILVGPDLVLTCCHVDETSILELDVAKLYTTFDDIAPEMGEGEDEAEVNSKSFRLRFKDDDGLESSPILASSEVSPFDVGETETHTESANLDYVLLKLAKAVGEMHLEDGRLRGWVDLRAATVAYSPGDDVRALGYPMGGQLGRSEGKILKPVIGNRVLHDATTLQGSSGGLIHSIEDLTPVAMHVSSRRYDGEEVNVAVPLHCVAEDLSKKFVEVVPETKKLKPVNLAVICGIPEDGHSYIEDLKNLLSSEELVSAFGAENLSAQVSYNTHEQLRVEHLFNVSSFSIEQMQKAAQADMALVIVSSQDTPSSTSKLLTAFGFLVARLGTQRVNLFHSDKIVDFSPGLVDGQFVHQYSDDELTNSAWKFSEIVPQFVRPVEDSLQGLFEIVRVALPELNDDAVFGTPEFEATQTLDIVGLRFGRLSNELDNLFDRLNDKQRARIALRIAFPGAEVSDANPYLLDALQAGVSNTVSFLEVTKEISSKFPHSLLSRITYVSLADIPTFMVTAADLDHARGKMLIAPVFPSASINAGNKRPRLLVHNKLSQVGVYEAYGRLLEELLDKDRTGVEQFTLDDTDALTNCIENFKRLGRAG